MGNSTSTRTSEFGVHPGYLQPRGRTRDLESRNSGSDIDDDRDFANTGRLESKTVVAPTKATDTDAMRQQRTSTSDTTYNIQAVKSGETKRNTGDAGEILQTDKSRHDNNSNKQVCDDETINIPSPYADASQPGRKCDPGGQQGTGDDVNDSAHCEIRVHTKIEHNNNKVGCESKITPEVVQSSRSENAKMESGVKATAVTNTQSGYRNGTKQQDIQSIEPKYDPETMDKLSIQELNKLKSQVQYLEDENLKLQHENKALRNMVDELTTRYLPEYSRRRGQSDSVRSKAGDQAEIAKQYGDLYHKEWMACKRMLERVSPVGRGPKYEDCHLRFLCDVIAVSYDTTRHMVKAFEENLATVLLRGVNYTPTNDKDESSRSARDTYTTVVKNDEELMRALKLTGERSLAFVRLLSRKCSLEDVVQRVYKELKEDCTSVLTPTIQQNEDLKNYIEKACLLTYHMNTLRPPVKLSYDEKRFVAVRHDPALGTTTSTLEKGIIDFYIWPALVDQGNNVLVKGKVKLS